MKDADIVNQLNETLGDMHQALADFGEDEINNIPFEGSWTAAQVADHVLKSASGALKTISGNTSPADRKPDEYEPKLRDVFLNFDTKMKSPDFILPSGEPLDKTRLLGRTDALKNGFHKATEHADLSLICLDFSIPGSPPMTRLEWLCFVTYHTRRHTHQLRNIRRKMPVA